MDKRELEIAGMSFHSYDSDRDPMGNIGLALASAEFDRRKLEFWAHQSRGTVMIVPAPSLSIDKYDTFYVLARGFTDLPFDSASGAKAEFLKACFPRFRKGGSQSLSERGYSPAQIGTIFSRLYEEAKKRVGKS